MKCPTESVIAAADDLLDESQRDALSQHLSSCEHCQQRLEQETADASWWNDAARFLDESVLDDPQSDIADSSSCDARLFDDDDPIMQLRSIGAIQPGSQPEILGQLGRYTIEREIGSGGMGVVVKAHDAELNRMVAIKVLAPHLARSGAAKQRFIREGRAAAAVVHENVVAIHEVDTTAALPYLVMRFIDGISLQRHVDLYGPLSVFDALRIASQAATGLAAAHRQGIIHRDVKPANILVNHSCSRTWISDFGLARAVDDASLTRTGFIAGTPHYMSPEQARGGDVGPRSDLFSLGAVIYFMFTGRPPWRAERSLAVLHRIVSQPHRPLWKMNSQIPRRVSDLVDRLLSKNVSDRPETAAEVQAELERVLSEMQNPESYPSSSQVSVVASSKVAWWSRPWFVAPVAAFLTLIVFSDPARVRSVFAPAAQSPVVIAPKEPFTLKDDLSNNSDYEMRFDAAPVGDERSPVDSASVPRLNSSRESLPNFGIPPMTSAPSGRATPLRSSSESTHADQPSFQSSQPSLPSGIQMPNDVHIPRVGSSSSDPAMQEIYDVEQLLREAEQFMQRSVSRTTY
ncbi:serine/threonine protein kinase [Stieleria sp. JC731]|uniref:serine/threonine-protein kinase n=1 Tax=Pirellulaceae TaxID=2691357 RepID=UPI001E4D23A0|nr:serine/threonine-protein kinase [Stieleria sp. JC731]MCC9602846.1 serine/threonine protein kinase [Stieleria sp. JC731]